MNPTASQPPSLRAQSLRTQKMRQTLKWTGLGIALLVAMFAGTFAGRLYIGNPFAKAVIKKILSGQNPATAFTPTTQFPAQHAITVLLLGCDHDYSEVLPGKYLKGSRGRSDAIMVARIDFDAPSISILSIPRDTAVRIPNKGVRKINSAYSIGGFELTQRTLQSVFGISVDYYATIDFEGFQKMVDAVGGVDLEVHKKLNYDDNWGNLHIHLKPGFQHLDGYQAMGYVRMRHSDSDFMRAKRQQEFLEALRGKVKDPRNFMRLPDALNAFSESLSSNMTHEQMLALANFAKSLPHEKILLNTLPCFEGPSFVYIDVTKSELLIRQLFPGTVVNIEAPDRKMLASASEAHSKKHKKSDRDDMERLDGGIEIPTSSEPHAANPTVDKQGHEAISPDSELDAAKPSDDKKKEPDTDKPAPDKTKTDKPSEPKSTEPKTAEPKPAEPKSTGDKPAEKPAKPDDTTKEKNPN